MQVGGSTFDSVYDEVKRIAHHELARHAGHTLDTTALVHEAYLKLAQHAGHTNDRAHLISLVVRAMRQVLIDAARRRQAEKRGGDPLRVTLDPEHASTDAGVDVLALDQAITGLKAMHERMGHVVEMHFFGGVEFNEIADLLGVTRRTVHRDWIAARALIADALEGPGNLVHS
jgi:RNA polymerase sigma factor (TIGR02999 family)